MGDVMAAKKAIQRPLKRRIQAGQAMLPQRSIALLRAWGERTDGDPTATLMETLMPVGAKSAFNPCQR